MSYQNPEINPGKAILKVARISFGVLFCISIFLLPAGIALLRENKKDRVAIIALNFFLFWTIIGWVISMVWALRDE